MALRAVVAAAVVAAALVLTAGGALAQQPIGQNQRFSGVVNGSTANAPVYVVCPGPISLTSKGHPIAGQSWQVILGGPGFGFTGSDTHIAATFPAASPQSTTPPVIFSEYGAPQPIPTSLLLPCGGTGTAVFTPVPPTPTGRAATVTVRFINLAV